MSRHVCIYRLTYILRYSYSYRFFGLSGISVFSGLSNSACKGTTKNAHMQIFTQLFLEKSFFYHFSSFPSAVFISSEASHFPANSPKICRNLSPTSPNHSRRNPEPFSNQFRHPTTEKLLSILRPRYWFEIGSRFPRGFLENGSAYLRKKTAAIQSDSARVCRSRFSRKISFRLVCGFYPEFVKWILFFDKKCKK